MSSSSNDIARAVALQVAQALAACRKVGTVSSISGVKVWVSINGGSILLPRMSHYTPTVGDVVQIDATVPDNWLVTGKVA